MRPVGVPHNWLSELGCSSISELEMYVCWRGLCVQYEVDALERDGYLAGGRPTQKAVEELRRQGRPRAADRAARMLQ
jgi:hypothetical protein